MSASPDSSFAIASTAIAAGAAVDPGRRIEAARAASRAVRIERAAPWLVFAIALVLYALTLYPGVGGRFQFGDGAKWQYVGHILGLSHPPGSPVYVLVSHVFSVLPLPLPIGTRVELLSALCGAAATALSFASARRLGLGRLASIVASIGFALSEATWTFATEAEVYALLGLVVTFTIHRALVWSASRKTRDVALVLFALALGMGVHYATVTLAPCFVVLAWQVEQRIFRRWSTWLLTLAALAVSLAPFAWLWWRAPNAPYSELGTPTLAGFVDYLLVRQYRGDLGAFALATLWFERAAFAGATACKSVGWIPLLLAPAGVVRLASTRRPTPWWLVLAAIGPLALVALHDGGDERGECIAALPAIMLAAAAAIDGQRGARIFGLGVVIFTAALTGVSLSKAAARDPLRRDTDEIHDYPWDVGCALSGAERGAVIVPPHADYGARQIVLYHHFTDPRARAVTFEWLEDPVAEWKWARPMFRPQDDDKRPVYVFRRDHEKKLTKLGYRSRELKYSDLGCSTEHPATVLFRLDR